MKYLTWLTDIHLEFLESYEVNDFIQRIANTPSEIILIGGDIGVASNIQIYLALLEKILKRPIYFVLGNHDFYGGSIEQVRLSVKKLISQSRWLRWLTVSGVVELSQNTGLIGHDSWADGRLGNAFYSEVLLNDFFRIKELTGLTTKERFLKLNALGDEAARYFQTILPLAVKRYSNLILLTHVPPFKEASWHEGKISDDEFLPHFTCSVVGNVLVKVMQENPQCHLTVLCGHTHSEGEASILPNLYVKTGGAVYGSPQSQKLIKIQ